MNLIASEWFNALQKLDYESETPGKATLGSHTLAGRRWLLGPEFKRRDVAIFHSMTMAIYLGIRPEFNSHRRTESLSFSFGKILILSSIVQIV